ncbi:MAG: hypothetical protein Q7T59_03405 [Candidatus Woesebacteria bacterium]|nr:hypothetical protein [Candidatus Woesebacteria bacterium]
MKEFKPRIETHNVPMETWVEDWDTPQIGDKFIPGILIEFHSKGIPMSDSDNSIAFKTCLSHPRCGPCAENKNCPIPPLKKNIGARASRNT